MAELASQCSELEADRAQFESDFAGLRQDIEQCAALQVLASPAASTLTSACRS